MNLKHQTTSELAIRFRELYRNTVGVETAKLATWVENRLDAEELTNTLLKNAFEMTSSDFNALRNKWRNLRTQWEGILGAKGE